MAQSTNCDSPRCLAKTKNGSPCQRFPLRNRTRCRLHGGLTPRGAAHPSFKHGEYSKYTLHIPQEFTGKDIISAPPIPVGDVMMAIRTLTEEIPKIFINRLGIQDALAINNQLLTLSEEYVKNFLQAHLQSRVDPITEEK